MKQTPVIVQVHLPRCPGCGSTVFRRGGSTRNNPAMGQVLRYRKCARCGKPVWLAYPAPDILPVEQTAPVPIDGTAQA